MREPSLLPPAERFAAADRLRQLGSIVPAQATDQFLERHPDWVDRYGDRARTRGVEDARYHLLYLASAIEAGTPAVLGDYARWAAGVLESRGIAPHFLAENLEQLGDAVAAHVTPPLAAVVAGYLAEAQAALAQPAAGGAAADRGPLANDFQVYLQASLMGERKAALAVITEALRRGAPPLDVYVDVLQATLYEVGRLWESNRITVAHEHTATAVTQFVLANIYEQLDPQGGARGRMIVTGLEGELHCVGAMMLSDALELRGWDVRFLGCNLPDASILDAVGEFAPQAVGISVTMLFNLAAARRLIAAIRERHAGGVRIMVGGAAFRHSPALWQEMGADGYARDLRGAVEVLCP